MTDDPGIKSVIQYLSRRERCQSLDWTKQRGDILANVGEFVTCENGHTIGKVKQTIYRDKTPDPKLIEWLSVPTPEDGPIHEEDVSCPWCGAFFVVPMEQGLFIHIEDEWR